MKKFFQNMTLGKALLFTYAMVLLGTNIIVWVYMAITFPDFQFWQIPFVFVTYPFLALYCILALIYSRKISRREIPEMAQKQAEKDAVNRMDERNLAVRDRAAYQTLFASLVLFLSLLLPITTIGYFLEIMVLSYIYYTILAIVVVQFVLFVMLKKRVSKAF